MVKLQGFGVEKQSLIRNKLALKSTNPNNRLGVLINTSCRLSNNRCVFVILSETSVPTG